MFIFNLQARIFFRIFLFSFKKLSTFLCYVFWYLKDIFSMQKQLSNHFHRQCGTVPSTQTDALHSTHIARRTPSTSPLIDGVPFNLSFDALFFHICMPPQHEIRASMLEGAIKEFLAFKANFFLDINLSFFIFTATA